MATQQATRQVTQLVTQALGKTSGKVAILVAFGSTFCSPFLLANVWVFEPSVSLDQRFDDNYYLIPAGAGSLSATRAVGEVGLSRESEIFSVQGLARLDALLTTSSDVGEEDLDSNRIAVLDVRRVTSRSRYGFQADYTLDTPSRDIAADISDSSSVAQDTGLDNLTQSLSNNVARQAFNLQPSYQYDITRRLAFDGGAFFTTVEHDLPDPQDAIYQRYLDTFPRNEDGSFDGTPLDYDDVTINTEGVGVFTPDGELDDYTDMGFDLGLRYQLDPITTLTASAEYSIYTAEVELIGTVAFDDLIADEDVSEIRRTPRGDSVSKTTTLRLGYERFLTPTLQFSAGGGVYSVASDTSDALSADEAANSEDGGKSTSNGFVASLGLDYDAGETTYSVGFAVDVLPSSSGSQVETNELTGQAVHTLSPRLEVAVYGRAYEPDRLGALVEDRFARRFISFEPRIQWQYSRNITLTAAYRYRRQKARVDPASAESNAVLLAIKYTPPSAVRDAATASGL